MAQPSAQNFPTGTRVQVRNRFNHHWASGFEVADFAEDRGGAAVRVRRLSDNSLIPVPFDTEDVREE